MRFTPAVRALLIANLVFYVLAYWITPLIPLQGHSEWFVQFNALYPLRTQQFSIYQYITYMFVHGGFMHLFFNMWQLIIFGPVVEQIYGTRRFAIYYFLCGIASALANQVCVELGIVYPALVIGASGAIYGVMAAAAFNFPNATMYIIPIPFPIKLKWLVVGFLAWDLITGVSRPDGVAHFAHLGGAVAGLAIVFFWKYQKSMPQLRRKPKMTVSYGGNHAADYSYNERRKAENDAIDRILDKVKQGGYNSLTAEEKQQLFDASTRR